MNDSRRQKLRFDAPLAPLESAESASKLAPSAADDVPEEDAPIGKKVEIPGWQRSDDFQPFGMTYSSNSANIKPIAQAGMRNEVIDKTLAFLRNPNVAGTCLSKQREFLIGKGVTEQELQYCLDKINSSLIDNLPTRPNYTNAPPSNVSSVDPFVVVPKVIHIPAPRVSIQEHLIRIIWTVAFSSGIVAAIGWVLSGARQRLLLVISEYMSSRGESLQSYILKLLAITKLYQPAKTLDGDGEGDYITNEIFGDKLKSTESTLLSSLSTPIITELPGELEHESSIPDALNRVDALLDAHTDTAAAEMQLYHNQISKDLDPDSTLSTLRKMADETSTLLTNETYFNTSSLYSRSSYVYNTSSEENVEPWIKTLQEIKSDIRSLKGGMLSRRNFASGVNFTTPKIDKTPRVAANASFLFKPRTVSAPEALALPVDELGDEADSAVTGSAEAVDSVEPEVI